MLRRRFLPIALLAGVGLAAPRLSAHCVGQPCTVAYRPGFGPLTIPNGGTNRAGHLVFADLGLTPGHKSLVFGTSTGRLYVVEYDGTVAPGFPVTLPHEIVSTPAVGRLTIGDGSTVTAIVVGYGSTFAGQSGPAGVRAYKTDGTFLWEAPSPQAVVTAPAIGDIDADGKNEVVWSSFDMYVHVMDGTGQEKKGFPYLTYDTIWSSPALFDLDGDGKLEIIVGSDQHYEPAPISTPDGGGLYVINSDGMNYPGFPKFFDQTIASSPAIGDIDGDGHPEIVVGTGSFWPNAAHRVYAFKCDGSAVPGWPVTTNGQVGNAPALADLDGDGVPDVVVTDDATSSDGLRRVYAFKGNGTSLFPPLVIRDWWGANLSAGDPMVADVLGDSPPEILIPTNAEICVVSSSGVQLTDGGPGSPNNITFGGSSSTALYAIGAGTLDDYSTKVDVVAVTGIYGSSNLGIWIFNPKPPTLPIPWGVFHQDPLHHGVVPGTPNCTVPTRFYTLAPCRILDTRKATGSDAAAPAMAGGETRSFTVSGRCGIPASAKALALNLTVASATQTGYLAIFAGNLATPPGSSSLNFRPGQARANNNITELAGDGSGTLKVLNGSSGTTNFVLDVSGYFQ